MMDVSSRKRKLNSIIFALMLCMNMLTGLITSVVTVNNLFPIAIALCGFLVITRDAIYGDITFKITPWTAAFLLIFISQFVFSLITISNATTYSYAQCFTLISLISLYVGMKELDYTIFRHTVIILVLISVSYYISLMTRTYTIYDSALQMGLAYALLPIICINIWTVLHSDDRVIWKVLSVIQLLMGIFIFTKFMTRGAWLCLIVFIMLGILTINIGKKAKVIMLLLIPFIVILFAYLIQKYFTTTDLYYSLFVQKQDDILNGRANIFSNALSYNGFFQFLFGSGIGAFARDYKSYAHNLIGQLYYDQGLIGVFIIMYPILYSIRYVIRNIKNKNGGAILLMVLLCSSVLRLMFSYYFWIDQLFWLLLGVSHRIMIKGDEKNTCSEDMISL